MIYDVCNIFKPTDNVSGNFLLFSQYTNDLAKSSVDPGYKVRPSRFFCLNLNSTSLNNLRNKGLSDTGNNYLIPGYLQNYFENGLSYMRTFKGNDYTPLTSSADFFIRLLQIILGDSWNQDIVGDILSNYIVYDNKIDLESWSDGFADVIINIPSNSSKKTYSLNSEIAGYSTLSSISGVLGNYTHNNITSYILGWESSDNLPVKGNVPGQNIICCDGNNIKSIEGFSVYGSLFNLLMPSAIDEESESFTFNTILLCYDIIDEHNNPIYTDIPMGMYFTGSWDNNNSFSNSVTIQKSVDSALNVGSSWSLRISTKFAPTPRGQLKVEDVAVESGATVSSLSAIMSANAELIKTINNMSKKTWTDTQSYRDLLAIFKDGRTNIPYTKTINGTSYWFVNGRNTGMQVYQ